MNIDIKLRFMVYLVVAFTLLKKADSCHFVFRFQHHIEFSTFSLSFSWA